MHFYQVRCHLDVTHGSPVYPLYNLGHTGQILDSITTDGFRLSDIGLFHLDRQSAEEFLEVYKGVVPEYNVSRDV